MTHDEFRQRYDAYEWEPYQPLAVSLTTGNRVYIDMPEQATLTADELVITRRQNPRKPEKYRYADIAQLIPLLDLPADPDGMSYAEFDPLIRSLLMAEPFQPFAIELKTGECLEINRRAEIGRACRHVTHFPPRSMVSYDFDQISRIVRKAVSVPA